MQRDLKSLQGEWSIVSLEMDGQAMPAGAAAIRVNGANFSTAAMGAEYHGKIELDESASPKSFDLHFQAGPEKGNTSHGIYELDGDTWKICMTLRGGTRPATFATKAGSGLALEILKRGSSAEVKAAGGELAGEPAPELAGEWAMVSAVMSGNPLEAGYVKVGRRIATTSELTVKVAGRTMLKASYAVDRSTTPMQMNYRLPDGRLQAGIWEFDGAQLKTCFAAPGAPRPADFTSLPGDARTSSVWKKL